MKKQSRLLTSSRHEFTYFKYGAHALLLQWKKSKDLSTLHKIIHFQFQLNASQIKGIIELVPAYHSLMIYFKPTEITFKSLIASIESFPNSTSPAKIAERQITIPVSYSTEHGPDQQFVADKLKISLDELIHLHTSPVYYVHFIGFLPGFVYLGGLDNRLNLPRREVPRLRIPAGSVAIAAGQTGIYPVDSPGGWHIIGQTDFQLFNPDASPPCPLTPGMTAKFKPI